MTLLGYFSSETKKKKKGKKKLGYLSKKKAWKKRLDEADPFLEEENEKTKED